MAKVGRPKKQDPSETRMVRVSKEANEMARAVCGHFGESISAYVDRIVRERASTDFDEIAQKRVAESEAKKKGKPSSE